MIKTKRSYKIQNAGSSGNLIKSTFKIIKNQKLYFLKALVISFIVYSFLYGIWKIPIIGFGINRMSRVNLFDYLFLLIITLFISIFLTLNKYEKLIKVKHDAKVIGSSSGAFAGLISAACPVCQGITLAALGSTIFTIPLNFLAPYLGFFKLVSVGLLGLAVFFKADSIFTKTCTAIPFSKGMKKIKNKTLSSKGPLLFRNNFIFFSVIFIITLLIFNQFLIPRAFASTVIGGGAGGNIGKFEYGAKITLKPMPLATGEQPSIQGYRSKVKPLPTISELQMQPSTGDPAQDLLNNVVPSGTPWYGVETGVSFDDPIAAQNLWRKGEVIQLDAAQEERWKRITNSFTCDYCCGSPQNPTIITQCGCAHAAAARGMAKWFIKNYGDRFSDEEIYGEMARWYAVWYPKGTIERIILEAQ